MGATDTNGIPTGTGSIDIVNAATNSYRFPDEIIALAVWRYLRLRVPELKRGASSRARGRADHGGTSTPASAISHPSCVDTSLAASHHFLSLLLATSYEPLNLASYDGDKDG
jgi:hypothetical protein